PCPVARRSADGAITTLRPHSPCPSTQTSVPSGASTSSSSSVPRTCSAPAATVSSRERTSPLMRSASPSAVAYTATRSGPAPTATAVLIETLVEPAYGSCRACTSKLPSAERRSVNSPAAWKLNGCRSTVLRCGSPTLLAQPTPHG